MEDSFGCLVLLKLFFGWVRKGWDQSLRVSAQKIFSQRVEVGVKTPDRPLQRVGLYCDHLGLAPPQVTCYLFSYVLVEGTNNACDSWGSGKNCIFRNLS